MPAALCGPLGDLLTAADRLGLLDRLPGVCAHAPELRELAAELRAEAYRAASGVFPPETPGSVNVQSWPMTCSHAAQFLGLSDRRIRQLAEDQLGGAKYKNRWRFNPDRLAEYKREKERVG